MNKEQSGFGIASLVIGIIGMLLSCIAIGIFPSVVGVILAIIALNQKGKGRGTAIAGLTCSIIGIVIFLICLLVVSGEEESGSIEAVAGSEEPVEKNEKETLLKEEAVIWKDNKCVIKAVECSDDSFKLKIKNGSEKDYSFDIHAMAINGVMTGCNIYTGSVDIPAGKKGIMSVDISNGWVDGEVQYIDMVIWAYDNAVNFKDFDTGIIRVQTNKYEKDISFKADHYDAETNGIGIIKNQMDNERVSYSIVNNNDYLVETNLENCSINDWAFEQGYSFDFENDSLVASLDGFNVIVFPNCIANVSVGVSDFMEENNIEDIENFEFSLDIFPNEDYEEEIHSDKIVFEK